MKTNFYSLFFLLLLPILGLAQRGPGGVTDDANTQRNCRLWLDAGDLTNLADGDPVNVWYDKSVSLVEDSAFWDSDDAALYLQPTFRDAPSAGINGKPVISFENGGMLSIGSWDGNNSVPPSIDLNSNPGVLTTYEQTMFFAFRTSNNVTDRQIIWEEGGSDRGFQIFINAGYVHIGAYDDRVDDDPGTGNVPAFGFTYKRLAVQPNTTYVLSFVYNVPTGAHNNELITNTYNPAPSLYTGLTGTLNGQPFPTTMITGCCKADGVGGVATHPDPIGVGGLNRTSYDETGDITSGQNATGTRLFSGRLAEICYYAFAMNDAERIIVENYLAAKYFSNVIANDKFVYEGEYGHGVIGIGQEQAGVKHDISQGDNLFEIRATNFATAFPSGSPTYVLVGHNNSQISWTNQNTPDSASIKRLRRIWRWDISEPSPSTKQITITLSQRDIDKLPALPAGHTKYGILRESTSANLPNFSPANSEVKELTRTITATDTTYSTSITIHDGEFLTLCAIKPTVQFELYSDYAIEGDPPPANFSKTAKLVLNYMPATGSSTLNVGYYFVDGTAVDGIDYNISPGNLANITSGISHIPFKIIYNDTVTLPPSKHFTIILDPFSTTSGLEIGQKDTLVFSIYDDDPTPKISFLTSASSNNEDAGIAKIYVQVLGTTTAPSHLRVIRPNTAIAGTADYLLDYSLLSSDLWFTMGGKRINSVTIPAGTNVKDSVYVTILADSLDEYDETIKFNLEAVGGEAGTGTGSILQHTLTITDQDPEPTASFASSSSEGYESISSPRIYVTLNTPSAKEISIPYQRGVGTATPEPDNNSDYAGPASGFLVFAAGEVEKYIPLTVYGNDASPEPDETVIYDLTTGTINAGLGTLLQHTYTIKEYSEFEWQGVAGIGKFNDNTFWMVPDAASPNTAVNNVPNLSPRPVQILQDIISARPEVTSESAGLNNHKMVVFNGTSDFLKVGGSGSLEGQFPQINSGGLYDNKSIFFVFSPGLIRTDDTPQIIYEEGGGTRGLSIYILKKKLYFYAWNGNNDGAYSPWGFKNHATGSNKLGWAFVESSIDLVNGQNYIVSCHYSRSDGFTPSTEPPFAGLRMYINGELQGIYTGKVGRLYNHSGRAAIGSAWHQSKIHNSTSKGPNGTGDTDWYFNGKIGEFLYLNEPKMNDARARILHNYLSSLYNIPLIATTQDFDLTFADNTSSLNPDFNYQMAGIGQDGSSIHGDSQGLSELRITNPIFTQNPAFLNWGNNNEALTNTWPYSNTYLPASIMERSGKTWRLSGNPVGGISSVDILVRYTTAQNATAFSANPDLLKLLINTTGNPENFSSATVINVDEILSGNVARFNNVPVTEGMYISLANTSAIYPLPVELLNFDVNLNQSAVDITWSTSTEINNDYFIIERADASLSWKELATVKGAGSSNKLLQYSEKDRNPLSGISYYRLKQVDFDGQYKYSDVVSVINSEIESNEDVFLYPNPSSTGSVFVRIPYAYSDVNTTVSFYNLSGVKVWQSQLGTNATLFELEYGNLPMGIYIVEFQSEILYDTKKLVIKN